MNPITNLGNQLYNLIDHTRKLDFLGPLGLRLFLAPIFIMAGWHKLTSLDSISQFFGDYLGLPAPMLMAVLAGLTEFVGGLALLLGFALRLMVIPIMLTMIVAATTVHWQNGWHVLPETTLTAQWEWREDLIESAKKRDERANAILQQHGNYEWLTASGSITVLKNGIEFAAIYFFMLLMLLFSGSGRYVSVDYWLAQKYRTPAPQRSTL